MKRSVRVLLVSSMSLALLIAAAPTVWTRISTMPVPSETQDIGSPFDFGGEDNAGALPVLPSGSTPFGSETRVRVLRWGPDRGERHGSYSLVDGRSRLREQGWYDRGIKVGSWREFDESGELLAHLEYDRVGLLDGRSIDGELEAEHDHGSLVRWRVVGEAVETPWIIPPSRGLVLGGAISIQSGSWKCIREDRLLQPIELVELTQGPLPSFDRRQMYWIPHGVSLSLGDSGRLDSVGPYFHGKKHGLWTYYGDDGEIEQQDIWLEGVIQLGRQRTAPPWYDIAPCFDPNIPIAEP